MKTQENPMQGGESDYAACKEQRLIGIATGPNHARPCLLMLEDNADRIAAFTRALAALDDSFEFRVWHDAPSMLRECPAYFSRAAVICLDHDLVRQPGQTTDPGDGLEVARFLADYLPVCPVLIHSSNTDRVYSMMNELRFASWVVDRVGPLGTGTDWIPTSWLARLKTLLADHGNTWQARLPPDHDQRVERMRLSLDGLGLGDALGEMLAYRSEKAMSRLLNNELPAGPWFHTDDTEMAISIVAVLRSHGGLIPDALARRFARRFERDPERGYGRMTRIQLREINAGAKWRETAANAFGGQGSMGNGGAMRVGPLGAYFAGDDPQRCAEAARESALVTHTHPEGVAGTVAVAMGAAMAWRLRNEALEQAEYVRRFFEGILPWISEGAVRRGVVLASQTPGEIPVADVARALGNGSQVTAPDTVPFCLWMAAQQPRNFVEALGRTISAGGDCDTNAAIVGGIVALSAGRPSIPEGWLGARERLEV